MSEIDYEDYNAVASKTSPVTPRIGTIIHGTHVHEDLLWAFATLLQEIHEFNEIEPEHEIDYIASAFDAAENKGSYDEMADLVSEGFDLLDAYSPPGYTFSTHPGDGSDFGFWPVENED